jgi:hypothetical protein
MNVATLRWETQWKNVEMTGYVKVIPRINEKTLLASNEVNIDTNDEES